MSDSLWVYRDYNPTTDEAFIYATWIDSFRESAFAEQLRPHTYAKGQHALIAGILKRPNAHITVACAPDNIAQIYGWICWEVARDAFVLHYVLTKRRPVDYQRMGVARGLIKPLAELSRPIYLSHLTHAGRDILNKHPMEKVALCLAYSPYLAADPEVSV